MSKKQPVLVHWLFIFASIITVASGLGVHQITPAPTPVLQARSPSQTAGFISSSPNSPLTCDGTSTFSTGLSNIFGCCDATTCFLPATCVTSDSPICVSDCPYGQITRCLDTASPSCAKYMLKTADDDQNPYTNFVCLQSASTILAFVSSAAGSDDSSSDDGSSDDGGSDNSSPDTVESSGVPLGSSVSTMSNSNSNNNSNGGLTEDQKIELGVGLSIPLAALIVAILAWVWPRRQKYKSLPRANP